MPVAQGGNLASGGPSCLLLCSFCTTCKGIAPLREAGHRAAQVEKGPCSDALFPAPGSVHLRSVLGPCLFFLNSLCNPGRQTVTGRTERVLNVRHRLCGWGVQGGRGAAPGPSLLPHLTHAASTQCHVCLPLHPKREPRRARVHTGRGPAVCCQWICTTRRIVYTPPEGIQVTGAAA